MDINDAWKSTCKIVLGGEIGDLEKYKKYLSKYNYTPIKEKSTLSKKPVSLSSEDFEKGANYLSQDEIDFSKKYSLDINKIKDLDSIIEELNDRFYYTGNKRFGKSADIVDSDGCFDSYHVKDSFNIQASKYAAYSSFLRGNCEYLFGSSYALKVLSSIRVILASHSSRCFDSYHVINSSDMFFTFNCHGCSNVMFSFNQRSKNNVIGNLSLPKDKYLVLRKKLIDESREYLEKNKDFYSIFDYTCPPKDLPKISIAQTKKEQNFLILENSFSTTCKVLFGKTVGVLSDFDKYLNGNHPPITKIKTAFGSTAYFTTTFYYSKIPKCRLVTDDEANEAAKISADSEHISSLESLVQNLDKIAFYVSGWNEGENHNIIESPIYFNSTNVFRSYSSFSKDVAYTIMAQNCESVYGCFRMLHSKFCVRCYYSHYLVRCFEVSDSSSSSDCYFCHNIENCQDCMFCFNVKAKRYAIGNVEIGKEEYLEIKKKMLAEIAQKLETNKKLDLSIFNIGARR